MNEKDMIPIKQEKEKKVEIVKDINSATDSEKELDAQKEQERKERIFLIQLIVVFVVWVFLIIMVMRDEKLPPKKPPTTKANNPITQKAKAQFQKTQTQSIQHNKPVINQNQKPPNPTPSPAQNKHVVPDNKNANNPKKI